MTEDFTYISLTESQQLIMLVGANETTAILSRGEGKTEFVSAPWIYQNILEMPRSNGAIVTDTYEHAMKLTIPGLKAGWEKLGIFENVHYWVGKLPPEELQIPKAFKHPEEKYIKHYISWWNGSGIYIMSLDGVGMNNGGNIQWLYGDEARNLNYPRIEDDIIPSMREYANLWKDNPRYLSKLWTTDQPPDSRGKWLFDMEARMNKRKVNIILQSQKELQELREAAAKLAKPKQKLNQERIALLEERIRENRMGLTYFIEGKPLANIRNLGMEWLKNQKRTLSPEEFDRAILNKRRFKLKGGFYSLLNESIHGYHLTDLTYLQSIGFNAQSVRDCRWDKDVDKNQPLDISCDYNNAINSIVTGQLHDDEYRFLSSKYVLNPLLLNDCIDLWHEYYQYHPTKVVNYYFDNTAIGGRADSDINYSDLWEKGLTDKGWTVNKLYIGQAPVHNARYLLWGLLFQGKTEGLPKFRFNIDNCPDWLISCNQAPIIRIGKKIEKDKSSEKPHKKIAPQHATHLSEAGDILIWAKLRANISSMTEFIGMITS